MKTKTIGAIITLILISGLNHSFSQIVLNKKNSDGISSISSITNTGDTKNTGVISDVLISNTKVQRSFISYFGETAENNWSMVGRNYLNSFHSNSLPANALFAKNGYLIYVITFGTEKNLPADVRKIVKREFYDYAITMAIEVKENNRDVWVVNLNNASEYITVRVENGEMEQVQKFQKTD